MSLSKFESDLLPAKSKNEYIKAWDKLVACRYLQNNEPVEESHISIYLCSLKDEKELAGPTLWCITAKLNGVYQAKFGELLFKKFSRILAILKRAQMVTL